MKKLVKKMIGLLVASAIGTGLILGFFALVGAIVEVIAENFGVIEITIVFITVMVVIIMAALDENYGNDDNDIFND